MASLSKEISIAAQVRRIKRELGNVVKVCSDPVKDTLFTQAALVAAEIRSVTPVDVTSDTPGALRESVRVEEGSPTPKKAVVVKIKAGGARTDGSGYDYARAVEFGTQKSPPHPFFFPIWRARRKGVKAAVRKAIKQAVSRVFK